MQMLTLIRISKFVLPILVIVFGWMAWHQSNTIKSLKMEIQNKNKLQSDYSLLEKQWRKQDTVTKVQAQNISEKNSEIYKIAKKNSQLAEIASQLRAHQSNIVDSIFIPFVAKVPSDSAFTKSDSIAVPQKFQVTEPNDWYKIRGRVLEGGVEIDSLQMNSDIQVTIGMKKQSGILGFLKKKTPVVEVVGNSPYLKLGNISNVSFKDAECPVCKYKYLVAGAILGILGYHFLH